MQQLSILLIYDPDDGRRPVVLTQVLDETVLMEAAAAALREAELRSRVINQADCVLGSLEEAERTKLERVFSLLLPSFRAHQKTAAVM